MSNIYKSLKTDEIFSLSLDTNTDSPLTIGDTNATSVDIAKTGVSTNIKGNVDVNGIYLTKGTNSVITRVGLGADTFITSKKLDSAYSITTVERNIIMGN